MKNINKQNETKFVSGIYRTSIRKTGGWYRTIETPFFGKVTEVSNLFYEIDELIYPKFRKKYTNVDFIKVYKNEAELVKAIKINEMSYLIERYGDDIKKVEAFKSLKFVRNAKKIREIKEQIEKEIIDLKKREAEILKEIEKKENAEKLKILREAYLKDNNLNDLDLKTWVNLPKELKHPCPPQVLELKQKSEMNWRDFEESIRND